MEGYFVMTMLADMADSKASIADIKKEFARLEKQMDLRIQIQHENIFKAMHRV